MFKKVVLCLAIVGVSGCDINLSSLRPIKWAAVDLSKVQEAIKEKVLAENPYPEELKNISGQENQKIQQQVLTLKSTAAANCKKKHTPLDMEPLTPRAPSPYADGVYTPQHQRTIGSGNAYYDCLAAIENDQLISDLKIKIASYSELQDLRRAHEHALFKKTEQRARDVIAEYGKSNGYDLVVEERNASVIYNASNMIVDITGGVLESISH